VNSLKNHVKFDEYSTNYKLLKRGVRFAPYLADIRRIEHVRKFDQSPNDNWSWPSNKQEQQEISMGHDFSYEASDNYDNNSYDDGGYSDDYGDDNYE